MLRVDRATLVVVDDCVVVRVELGVVELVVGVVMDVERVVDVCVAVEVSEKSAVASAYSPPLFKSCTTHHSSRHHLIVRGRPCLHFLCRVHYCHFQCLE